MALERAGLARDALARVQAFPFARFSGLAWLPPAKAGGRLAHRHFSALLGLGFSLGIENRRKCLSKGLSQITP
jgi:hypothetical protein